MTSKSLSEGSLRNSSLAQVQLAIRVSCAGVSLATSESWGGGRPARFSGATRFGLAFVTTVGATQVALWVRQQAMQQSPRGTSSICFAAGVAQTAQGRSGRGIGVAFMSDAARAGRCSSCCGGGMGLSRDSAASSAQACFIAVLRSRRASLKMPGV